MGLPARCTFAVSGVLEVHGGWCRVSKHLRGSLPTDLYQWLSIILLKKKIVSHYHMRKEYSFVQIGLGLFYKLKMIQSL